MTRGALVAAGACAIVGLALWALLIAGGVALAEWKRVPLTPVPMPIYHIEPESVDVWVGPDSSVISAFPGSLITIGPIAQICAVWVPPQPDRVVNIDSLLTEIREGHDAEIVYLDAIGRAR